LALALGQQHLEPVFYSEIVMRGLCVFAWATCFVAVAPTLAVEQNQRPSPLSAEVVAAWREAGAQVGWVGRNTGFYPEFRLGVEGKAGEVPTFAFGRAWKAGVLAKLPPPEHPFGLLLSHANVTDAGLKELAGFKSLQNLILYETKVTDAGLKELGGLNSLQSLDLGWTQLTDLKELGGLNSLQSLSVSGTKVTNAGLKGLAGLKSLQWLDLRGTQVTAAGVAELKKKWPGLGVIRGAE
jgi:internalin A